MKIINLKAENVKRLAAVQIEPDGSLVVIGGKNGAGKSSVLDSIIYVLSGAGSLPPAPVRKGEKKADIEITIDSDPPMVVHRRISASGKTSLEIKQVLGDGIESKIASPQKLLDTLCGKIAFDPLAFTRLAPQKQADVLREVVGVDLSEIDTDCQQIFERRTGVNRESNRIEGELQGLPRDDSAPTELVDVSDLMKQVDEIAEQNRHHRDLQTAANELENRLADRERAVGVHEDNVRSLEERLEEAKDMIGDAVAELDSSKRTASAARKLADASSKTSDEDLKGQIAAADTTNQSIRNNQRHDELKTSLADSCKLSEGLTDKLSSLKEDRITKMDAAEWPVEGLGFSDTGVVFEGLPFGQCSSAEKLKISASIGLAQHPKLKVLLVEDGSLLDQESMATLKAIADEHDAQIWIERVGDGDECSVIIEDGAIAS